MAKTELERVAVELLEEICFLKPHMVLVLRLLPKLGFSKGMIEFLDGYIESLVDNLEYLLKFRADFVVHVKEKLDVIKGNLKHLYHFVSFSFMEYLSISVQKNFGLCHSCNKRSSKLFLFTLFGRDEPDCICFIHLDLLKSSKPFVEALKALPSVSFTWKLDAFAEDFVNFILQAPITVLNSPSYLMVYKYRAMLNGLILQNA